MRLFLNTSTFISVIQEEKGFDCQIMELVNGYGMYLFLIFVVISSYKQLKN